MNSAKDIICFDLDGTLADYSEGWQGVENIGRPMGRAKKLLLELYKNYRIVIYTCRTNPALNAGYTQDQLVNYVEQWFTKHDLPYDEIYVGPGKPHAKVFLDDRAFFYNGSNNHENAIDRIKYLCQF